MFNVSLANVELQLLNNEFVKKRNYYSNFNFDRERKEE